MFQVEVVIGSESDLGAFENSGIVDLFKEVGIEWRLSVLSAHRNDADLTDFCSMDIARSTKAIIALAGRAAALAGSIVAKLNAPIPVIGVALSSSDQPDALDATLSMTRTPAGTAIAFAGMNKAGIINAAILACQIVGQTTKSVRDELVRYQVVQKDNKPGKVGLRTHEAP